ncbi:helix-turn-helix transcriptional regulator [Viridibacillus arvi]|uniref:helix-turn-helix transcriptional regulator n=1 Tax=Viridibacillus arvi TaxID=263475 RepID=UPI003D035DF7
MALRQWLIDKRLDEGYTQATLAKEADIGRSYYSLIENNKRTPRPKVSKKIASILTLDWTLFYKD